MSLDQGFYLEKYNFSVCDHDGEWVMRARKTSDNLAITEAQIKAIEMWAQSNKDTFNRTGSITG